MPILNCDSVEYQEYQTYALEPQSGALGSCWDDSTTDTGGTGTCTLGFTGATITNATSRGGVDGQIIAYLSGSTGTTYFYVNGKLRGGGSSTGITVSNLVAGYYTIAAEEGSCYTQLANLIVGDGAFRTGDFTTTAPSGELMAANNPIPFTLQTFTSSLSPVKSKSTITVSGTVNDGDWVRFRLAYPNEIDVTITAKNYPDRDEYFLASTTKDTLGVPIDTSTSSEIAQSIGESISKNVELSRLYDIIVIDSVVTLTAKEANPNLDLNYITLPTSTTAITSTIVFEGVSAYDGQIVENYSVYADIYVKPNAQWGLSSPIDEFVFATQLELPFQSNNIHRFNLAPIVRNYVSTPKLDWTLTGFTTLEPMLAEFKVVYGEKFPLIANTNTKKSRYKGTSESFYSINSSLAWEDSNDMSEYTGSFLHNLKSNFLVVLAVNPTVTGFLAYDYLIDDTDTTTTTDIMMRVVGTFGTVFDSGWVDPTVLYAKAMTTYSRGTIEFSGVSSGVNVTYERSWFSNVDLYSGAVYGSVVDQNIFNNVKFLTNKPTVLDMQRDGSDWLYLMLPRDYGKPLSIVADLYFYNGDALTGQTLYDVFTGTTNAGGVFTFGSGYEQLGLAAYETSGGTTRKIRRVDFAVYQDDATLGVVPLSEVRSYRYEIDEQPSTFEVAFLNELGCYDTFSFVGEIVDNVERETGNYEVPLEINGDGSLERGFQKNTVYNTKITKTIKANSGWIDEDHRDWLVNSLLNSNRIYQITDGDENFLTIASVQTSTKSSNETLYQLNVTFKLTQYENNVNV